PKSPRSDRTIRIPEIVRGLFGGSWPGSPYRTAASRWKAFLAKLGLRYRNLHQLRHSVASHAIAAGVPPPNRARDLGDTVDTIVKTYLHATPGEDVCEAMERLLSGNNVAANRENPAISSVRS